MSENVTDMRIQLLREYYPKHISAMNRQFWLPRSPIDRDKDLQLSDRFKNTHVDPEISKLGTTKLVELQFDAPEGNSG